MPRYPETLALLEQALRHVLSEQQELLKRQDVGEMPPLLSALTNLALHTSQTLAEGFSHTKGISFLTDEARKAEQLVDNLSESLWSPIQVSVSAIYERAERSLRPRTDEYGFAAEIRTHYHNLRLRLLEQMISARMLPSSSDLGEEVERIWQQFLERHLGPAFRILRGGYICDHKGNKSCQVDLIVVAAEAHVFVPGDSEDGKAHVLLDQVISAILVTANLTVEKLKSDWQKFESIPMFSDKEKDYPQLKGQPWPFLYILSAQSDTAEELKKVWVGICEKKPPVNAPQFVVALDEGFLFSGFRHWPAPRFPGNYVEAVHVYGVTELFAGLGLAWLLAQHQGRLAVIQRHAVGPVKRFADLLDTAMMPMEAVPPTHSMRFETMFEMRPIAGVMEWGSVACWAHNRLKLRSMRRVRGEQKRHWDVELMQPSPAGVEFTFDNHTQFLRWFRYHSNVQAGRLIAVEEWLNHKSKTDHKRRIAVFDTVTGDEIFGPLVEGLISTSHLERVRDEVEASLPLPEKAADISPRGV